MGRGRPQDSWSPNRYLNVVIEIFFKLNKQEIELLLQLVRFLSFDCWVGLSIIPSFPFSIFRWPRPSNLGTWDKIFDNILIYLTTVLYRFQICSLLDMCWNSNSSRFQQLCVRGLNFPPRWWRPLAWPVDYVVKVSLQSQGLWRSSEFCGHEKQFIPSDFSSFTRCLEQLHMCRQWEMSRRWWETMQVNFIID